MMLSLAVDLQLVTVAQYQQQFNKLSRIFIFRLHFQNSEAFEARNSSVLDSVYFSLLEFGSASILFDLGYS